MKPSHFLILAVAALLPLAAAAQDAHTTKTVNLRAGPARDYPLVASFGPGTPLAVQGCTEGFGWCDVIGPSDVRGWIYAGNIAYPYQSADVPVLGYGTELGFPIVTFTLGSYWGQYYR
ncbi:MAG: SH3 domain-containing protein, partial [Pseudomonadota bacterium]|nr:SH3 domain-containing protein [Pseudomonadota bacterium]